jgi:hypothetical protein
MQEGSIMTQQVIQGNAEMYQLQGPEAPRLFVAAEVSVTAEVFGTLFFEVTLERSGPPALPGWTLRLWPQARLGDATLEARTEGIEDVQALLDGLAAQGVYLLGPLRRRQGAQAGLSVS